MVAADSLVDFGVFGGDSCEKCSNKYMLLYDFCYFLMNMLNIFNNSKCFLYDTKNKNDNCVLCFVCVREQMG